MKFQTNCSLAAVILLVSSCLSAQVQLADTPAAHQLSGWLAAFNSGDKATVLEFLQKNYPVRVKEIDGEMRFHEQTGGFNLKKAEECAATKCAAILEERNSEQFARIEVEVDPAEPHVIKAVELRAIPRPAEFPISRMTEADARKVFRAYLDQTAAADRFAGAVLVAKSGKPIFTAVYGMADRDKKIPTNSTLSFASGR